MAVSTRQQQQFSSESLVALKDFFIAMVASDNPDLTARQLAVFLRVYLDEPPHTVRGLAAILNVSKPAITRALDRLTEYDMIARKQDAMDRRSVLVQRTREGSNYLRQIGKYLSEAQHDSSSNS